MRSLINHSISEYLETQTNDSLLMNHCISKSLDAHAHPNSLEARQFLRHCATGVTGVHSLRWRGTITCVYVHRTIEVIDMKSTHTIGE